MYVIFVNINVDFLLGFGNFVWVLVCGVLGDEVCCWFFGFVVL